MSEKLYLNIMLNTLYNGEERNTRSGKTFSVWDELYLHHMSTGFPLITTKKMFWQAIVGELLWFLNGETTIEQLKYRTFGDANADKWTIWTEDAKRSGSDDLGPIYGSQWREWCGKVDQIKNLIDGLRNDPLGRRHIVTAWNPADLDKMALPPCHYGFQCYVTNEGELNLKWYQRSVDVFLGLPFNIASYGLLQSLIAEWTGLTVGMLSGTLGDVHVYEAHADAVNTQLGRSPLKLPSLVLPEAAKDFDNLKNLTALDFKDALVGYESHPAIKAPLLVG